MKKPWLYVLCFILHGPQPAFLLKLNVERLLLPPNTGISSNFSLELSDYDSVSCYEWKSSSPELLNVKPFLDEGISCSTKAFISVLSQKKSQQEVLVSVLKSGVAVLFCEVIINKVQKIELHHETSNIYVSGPPVRIVVIAKDENGNTFSSLNGVKFQWKMTGSVELSNSQESMDVVRPIDSSQSHVDINQWKYPNLLFEGITPGEVLITTSLEHETAANAATTNMMLKISSNVMIQPSGDIYSFVGAIINFNMVTKYEHTIDITHYNFMTDNSLVAKFENQTSLTILTQGQTSIFAEDNYGNHFNALVHVVQPTSISIEILNSNDWSLQEAKSYDVLIHLWDSSNNKIHFSENIDVHVSFPSKYFHVNSSVLNGLRHTVLALVPGSGVISAEFHGIKANGISLPAYDLKTSQKFIIYQAIQISPSVLLLPYYNVSHSMYNITFKASGGTGFYSWSTSDAIATNLTYEAKSENVALLKVYKEGDFVITAKDRNPSISIVSSKVSVQYVADIEVYPTVVEAEIGNEVLLPVGVLGYECKERRVYRVFDDCRNLNLDVEIIDKHIVAHKPDSLVPSFGRGCHSMRYLCLQPGHSRINLSYKDSQEALKTTIVIACHKPLKPIHPIRVAVFALGTSKEVAFEGGPRPWPLFTKGHFLKLTADEPQIVNVTLIKDPIRYNKDLHIFNITCIAIGEVLLNLHIGNKASPTNPNPAQLETSIRAVCNKPNSIHLAYKTKDKKLLTHTKSGRAIVKVPFYGTKQFEIDLWVKDEIGRKFSNISTFTIHWKVSDHSIATPIENKGVMEFVDGSGSFRKISRHFQQFQMIGKPGQITVEAILTSYNESKFQAGGLSDIENLSEITGKIELELISLRDLYNNEQEEEIVKTENCDGDTCQS